MAGLGFKDFAVGEVLTSADVDGYLMQQTVMRFADAGARGSALGTATGAGTALAEGMVSYLDDANRIEFYNGTEWRLTGSIVQVVSTISTTVLTTTSTTYQDASGLAVTITPTSASSDILLLLAINLRNTTNRTNDFQITATTGTSPFGFQRSLDANSSNIAKMMTWNVIHSPGTTSAVTYQLQWKVDFAETQTISQSNATSSIIAMEVA